MAFFTGTKIPQTIPNTKDRTQDFSNLGGKFISDQASKEFAQHFEGTALKKPMSVIDKLTKSLSDKSDKWAGKKPEGEKK